MDREQFDALARRFASTRSRRSALGALVSAALLVHGAPVRANPGKAKGKGHNYDQGLGHEKGNGLGHEHDNTCNPDTCAPGFCCKDGSCSCDGQCCGVQCFLIPDLETGAIVGESCCSGPKVVYCPDDKVPANSKCCLNVGEESCLSCIAPSGLAGSYRRP